MVSGRRIDIFEGIDPVELEQEQPEPWWRQPLLIVIGVFLLVLVVSITFSDALRGIVQSRSVRNNELVFGSVVVRFENNTLELLQNEFVSNEHREIKACLFGFQSGSLYVVDRVEFPDVIRANVLHIVSISCPIDALIDLHSHPINQCLASEQDIAVYNDSKKSNPSLRMMVMCSSSRFALV